MLRVLTIGAAVALSLHAFALGQEAPKAKTFDETALKDALEEALPGAGAFARSLEARIEAAQKEAQALAETAQRTAPAEGGAPGANGVDLDALLAAHGPAIEETRAGRSAALPFLAFISLSMPAESLKPLLEDVHRAGGLAVLRGFKDGSVAKTAAALKVLTNEDAPPLGAIVDPRLFRSFGVESVPAFVMPAGPLGNCSEPNCIAPAPPHDRLAGNVTVRYALEKLAQEGDAARPQAQSHLDRLEARP